MTFLLVVCGGSAARADKVYFTIVAADGKIPPFAVTDAVIAKAGTISYKAMLPGMDDEFHEVRGPLVRDLLKQAGESGTTAFAIGLDTYEVEIPLSDFQEFQVIAAIEVDGKAISVREKGPAWIVYPTGEHAEMQKSAIYEARSIWQLKQMSIK